MRQRQPNRGVEKDRKQAQVIDGGYDRQPSQARHPAAPEGQQIATPEDAAEASRQRQARSTPHSDSTDHAGPLAQRDPGVKEKPS